MFGVVTRPQLARAIDFVTCSGTTCSACNFVEMANAVIVWLIGMVFVIFAVIAVIAGFKLITSGGNIQAVSDAKSKLTNALIGLIIVLAGWLLVDTIMRGLLVGSDGSIGGYGPWSEVKCGTQKVTGIVREGDNPAYETVVQNTASGIDGVEPAVNTSELGYASHQDGVSALNPGGFTLTSSGACTDKNNKSCTSLEGIRPTTINRVNELQKKVNVPLNITGGTETGHSEKGEYTHGNGYKVDIRPNDTLNNYIYTNFTKIGPTKYKDSNGNTYYRHEPDHWDITITN